ncbi:hypothetical protein CWI84_09565 [Idiomarina tyrosinivorans]|uniref:Uncharacterized protein n=1 Tax=Idiomarina tyrosinivorans TaxID=1445662 RepID=A0A432ZPQ4_9GAMM|nr:hypothetical protein [Idiomarina tyrosinivorans]RUO79863.1 hypothetical protein CWI84_09565 [Idiomarina tyrosinivorans]
MSKYYQVKQGAYPEKKRQSSSTEYVGESWSIKREEGKYILRYVSGGLQGAIKSVEVSKKDFEEAHLGEVTLNDLSKRYKFS